MYVCMYVNGCLLWLTYLFSSFFIGFSNTFHAKNQYVFIYFIIFISLYLWFLWFKLDILCKCMLISANSTTVEYVYTYIYLLKKLNIEGTLIYLHLFLCAADKSVYFIQKLIIKSKRERLNDWVREVSIPLELFTNKKKQSKKK